MVLESFEAGDVYAPAKRLRRYTEHEFDEALIKTLRDTCLKYIETEHDVSLKEVADFIRNAVRCFASCCTACHRWVSRACLPPAEDAPAQLRPSSAASEH